MKICQISNSSRTYSMVYEHHSTLVLDKFMILPDASKSISRSYSPKCPGRRNALERLAARTLWPRATPLQGKSRLMSFFDLVNPEVWELFIIYTSPQTCSQNFRQAFCTQKEVSKPYRSGDAICMSVANWVCEAGRLCQRLQGSCCPCRNKP
jgi:hypothetical protein